MRAGGSLNGTTFSWAPAGDAEIDHIEAELAAIPADDPLLIATQESIDSTDADGQSG